jgi:hypothetical protein
MNTAVEVSAKPSNPISLFLNLWTSPSATYPELKPNTRFWYPLLAIMLLQIGVTVYYSMSVDFAWMMEQTMSAAGRDMSPEQREGMERMQESMGGTMSAVFGSIAILIIFPLMFSLLAGYFTVVSSFTADGIRFGQWFGFVCWSATPILFATLASFVTILLSNNGQIMQSELNPLSLNSLIFKLPFGAPGSTFLSSVDLTMIWSLGLNIIGYRVWTGKSLSFAAVVASAPSIVILSIFGFISFS